MNLEKELIALIREMNSLMALRQQAYSVEANTKLELSRLNSLIEGLNRKRHQLVNDFEIGIK